jgi:hypothetical protein
MLCRIGDGKQPEILATITDPVVFSRPWKVRFLLSEKPGERIEEYTCGQGPILDSRYGSAGSRLRPN